MTAPQLCSASSQMVDGKRPVCNGVVPLSRSCRAPVCRYDELPERCDSDNGGGSGIRTHGALTDTTVFETARFGHSRIPPAGRLAQGVATICEEVPQERTGRTGAHAAGDFDLVVEAGIGTQIEQ